MAFHTKHATMPTSVDEEVLARHPWYLVGVLLIIASLVVRQPLLVVAGLLVVALGGVPELWYRFCLSGLVLQRKLSTGRAQIGDEVFLTLTVENRKLLPLPRLEVVDEVPSSGLVIRGGYLETSGKPLRLLLVHLLSPWALQRVTRRYHVSCFARGTYFFGPVRLESGDPFGLLTREEVRDLTASLLIYPLVVSLERLSLPAGVPIGERTTLRRVLEDPLRPVGVRAYTPGDEPRRIHWKATARTGSLQSKIYEATTQHTLALFVDARTLYRPALGYDPDLFELALCAAASVANWGSQQGYAIGLYSNGLQIAVPDDSAPLHPRLTPSAAPGQLLQVQEALARLVPYYTGSMAEVLLSEERTLPFGSTIVYICSAALLAGEENEELALLRRMRRRGYRVAALVTGETADLPPEAEGALDGLATTHVGTAATWQELYHSALELRGLDTPRHTVDQMRSGTRGTPATGPSPQAPATFGLPWGSVS